MTREYTNRLIDMIDEGLLSREYVIIACLKYMGEDEVKEMMRMNEIAGDEEE